MSVDCINHCNTSYQRIFFKKATKPDAFETWTKGFWIAENRLEWCCRKSISSCNFEHFNKLNIAHTKITYVYDAFGSYQCFTACASVGLKIYNQTLPLWSHLNTSGNRLLFCILMVITAKPSDTVLLLITWVLFTCSCQCSFTCVFYD